MQYENYAWQGLNVTFVLTTQEAILSPKSFILSIFITKTCLFEGVWLLVDKQPMLCLSHENMRDWHNLILTPLKPFLHKGHELAMSTIFISSPDVMKSWGLGRGFLVSHIPLNILKSIPYPEKKLAYHRKFTQVLPYP